MATRSPIHGLGACVGHRLALGRFDHATELTQCILDGLDRDLICDGGEKFGRRRTQYFVLRVAHWQGWPPIRCAPHRLPVHDLHHTMGMRLHEAGVTVGTIADILRHST